jgi:acyl dehydratase
MTPRPAVSEWMTVTQERIDSFADATGDHQWLHVDPQRAANESPFGAAIAHGFLTLSLISPLIGATLKHDGKMAVSYGLNKVRFLRPVIAGSKIRARFQPIQIEEKPDYKKVTWKVKVESEAEGPRPEACCVAEWIVAYYQ